MDKVHTYRYIADARLTPDLDRCRIGHEQVVAGSRTGNAADDDEVQDPF